MLRELEAILQVNKLARAGQHVDALREIIKIPFLPLNPLVPDVSFDIHSLSPYVQACVPDILKVTLVCLENVKDSDGTLRSLKSKVSTLCFISSSKLLFHNFVFVLNTVSYIIS